MPFDGTQLNETAAHLLRAKRYIEEHGWGQGRMEQRVGGPVCILGALYRSLSSPTERQDGYDAVSRGIKYLSLLPNLGTWNDTPGRTVEEVYAAFDRAIALAMESGE